MELKKENLVAYKHLSGLEVAGLNQFFDAAAAGDVEATFRLGLRMYNMVLRLEDKAEQNAARKQALSLIHEAAAHGETHAAKMMFDLARHDEMANDLLERRNDDPSLRL